MAKLWNNVDFPNNFSLAHLELAGSAHSKAALEANVR